MKLDNYYVVVFAFDELCKHVVLIEKQKPVYLAGKWNGPGGKVEEHDKTIFHAAAREFAEETGVNLRACNLEHIIHMMFYPNEEAKKNGEVLYIDFIMAKTDLIFGVKQIEKEVVTVWPVHVALGYDWTDEAPKLVSNLYWMLPFAIDKHRTALLHCEEVQRD